MMMGLKMAKSVVLGQGEYDCKMPETNPFNNSNCDCLRLSPKHCVYREDRENRKRRRIRWKLPAQNKEINEKQQQQLLADKPATYLDLNTSDCNSISSSTAATTTTTAATYSGNSKWTTTCPTSTTTRQNSILPTTSPTGSPLCSTTIHPAAAISCKVITFATAPRITLKTVPCIRTSAPATPSSKSTNNISPRTCKRRTSCPSLNTCKLLPRLLTTLVWHVTASTVIAVLATLCYILAHTQSVAAITATAAIAQFPYTTTSVTTATTPTRATTTTTTSRTTTSPATPLAASLTLATNFTFDATNSSNTTTTKGHRNGNSRLSRKGNNKIVHNSSNNNRNDIAIDTTTSANNNIWLPYINTTEMIILNDVSSTSATISTSGYDNYITTLATTNHYGDVAVVVALNDSNSRNITGQTGDVGGVTDNTDVALDDISAEDVSEYVFDRTDVRIIFITLYTMVFCCCFFGNLLVILVVTLSRRLRSITNFFLANLALADFCVGLFCVMQNLSIYLIDSWVFGEFLCRMYQFVHSLSYTASIFILVVICMERYFAIVHPITCKQILTAARLRMVILTVWITSAVYSTPKFVFSKTIKNVHTESGQEEEICVLDRKMFNSKLLDMINFGLLYVIPLLVMTVLYSKIAICLWRSSRGLSHHLAQQQDNSMGLHNSMYHHHNHHHNSLYNSHQHHALHNNHQLQQSSTTPAHPGLSTPLSLNSSVASGGSATLSRKQSSKYEKRGVSITESQHDNFQVSLDADRPVVSACRKTSFYQHNHLAHPQQSGPTTALTAAGNHQHHRPHLHNHNHGNPHAPGHGSQRVSHISHSSNNVLRARRGVVRMLIIFVLTFALCNLPYHARKMWQYWSRSYRGDSNFNALLTPLTFLVTYFNSGINPLLYAFLSRNFRKGMKELLMCSWRKGKTKSSTNSSMHHKRATLQTHSLPTDTTHIGNEQL